MMISCMMRNMEVPIRINEAKLQDFCHRWNMKELALFGSILTEQFRPNSDIDVLVTFYPNTHYSLFDMVRMETELETILGRQVDLVERSSIEQSENYLRRDHILSKVQPLYVA